MSRSFAMRRAALALGAGGASAAVCMGAYNLTRQYPRPALYSLQRMSLMPSERASVAPDSNISSETVRQISSGSITGFAAGVIVAIFSRTLAILGGLTTLFMHLAARQGLDIPRMVGADTILKKLHLWERTQSNPWFVSAFALTFTLAAFVRL
ncbi:hypothetical protein NLU13_7258 [Sarocladium strictum]|uniref:Uncharacterized protein n=1 Tax=Sarocladium strictum TaxID=5046 RepID=A0AA39GCH4_SARSR|nr:hypothetical protein NLU13_7258 [Sarocladium strictum]